MTVINTETVLDVRHLKTSFYDDSGTEVRAVDDLSYSVHRGECVAIIGESGSGKTVEALSVLRLIPFPPGYVKSGEVIYRGKDMLQMKDEELKSLRGSSISMIFQEPGTALNPVMTIGDQIAEPLIYHKGMSRKDAYSRVAELLESVEIPNAKERIKQYPHQFSGGMQQRAMIAMAMSCEPDILIADEPTTALDVTVQAQVLEQLEALRKKTDAALIIITHNLGIVARYADSVKIMYGGRIVEEGNPIDIFEHPHHPYTLGLVRAVPRLDLPRSHGLHPIKGEPVDMSKLPQDCCPFEKRCAYATVECGSVRPTLTEIASGHFCACFHEDMTEAERAALPKAAPKDVAFTRPEPHIGELSAVELPLGEDLSAIMHERIARQDPIPETIDDNILKVEQLKMWFPVTKGLFNRRVGWVKAVDDVSFSIQKGKTLGIVGESGSGKSTVGHCLIGEYDITAGNVMYNGQSITKMKGGKLRRLRKEIQMVTQDPFSSLDPRMTIKDAILEGVHVHGMSGKDGKSDETLVREMMELVGLNPVFSTRFPHEFSGGQRQRISIARALALEPAFIVCDEVVSALDVSIQAQIIGLLMDLQKELGLTYVFIGHDLSVIRHISDSVIVMYLGKVMEMTASENLYKDPLHPYTKALISAVPIPNPTVDRQRERILLTGEMPSPINTPKGCNFCTRCRDATDLCREEEPVLKDVFNGHYVACHYVKEMETQWVNI